jgi:adenylate kinase
VYNKETKPVADYYHKKGLYKSVDGVGSLEEITERLISAIQQ